MSERFLIQRAGYYVGNSVVWWRPNCSGYTTNLDEAGRYSAAQAEEITGHPNSEDFAWDESEILPVAHRHVDAQYMPRKPIARAQGKG